MRGLFGHKIIFIAHKRYLEKTAGNSDIPYFQHLLRRRKEEAILMSQKGGPSYLKAKTIFSFILQPLWKRQEKKQQNGYSKISPLSQQWNDTWVHSSSFFRERKSCRFFNKELFSVSLVTAGNYSSSLELDSDKSAVLTDGHMLRDYFIEDLPFLLFQFFIRILIINGGHLKLLRYQKFSVNSQ